MAQGKPLQTLYQSLKDNNYDVPETYDSFERTLTLPGNDGMNNRRALYEALRDDNYDVPDTYESFANTLFAPAQKANPVQAAEEIKTGGNAQPQQQSMSFGASLPTWDDVKKKGLNFGGSNPYMVQKPLITQPKLQDPTKVDTGFETLVDKNGNFAGSKFVGQEGTPVQKFVEYQDKKAEEERNRPFEERVSSVFDQYSSGDEAEQAWNEAEQRSNNELKSYLEKRNKPTFGNLMRDLVMGSNVTGGAGVDAAEMGMEAFASHLKYHDLQKMSDAAWNRMDEEKKYSIVTDIYRKLQEYYPDADKDALMSDAMKIARQESDKRVYDLAVQKNTPKDALDLFFRKAALGTSIGDLMMAGARAKAGTTGDLAAREEAEQLYEKEHKLAGVAGTVAGFAFDPLVYAGGAIGSLGARGTLSLLGKAAGLSALRGGATSMVANRFGQMAARKFGTTLGGRLLSGAIGGGLNFGTYEAGREATGQLKWGGYRNPKTGEIEDYNLGEVGKRFAHGLGMGAATGTISPLLGNISDKLVRATQSTAGKMAYRAGELGVGTVAEGTIFSVPEAIQTYSDYDELINSLSDENSPNYIADDAERAAKIKELTSSRNDAILDVWTDNMIMMAGFKANHLLKSAPRVIQELSQNPTRSKAGFETRLRKMLDGQEGLALTKDEKFELNKAGYYDLSSLVESYEYFAKKPERAVNEKENSIVPFREGIPYNRFEKLMNDASISEAARAKMYYYLTGHVLPMSTITGYKFIENKDADGHVTSYTVESRGNNGVVTSRTFENEGRANVELDNVKRQIELNTIDVGERYYKYGDKNLSNRRMEDAVRYVADDIQYNPEQVYEMLREKPENLTQMEKRIVEAVQKEYDRVGEESLGKMRDGVNEKYGVDVDKAIGKEPQRRSEQEKEAVKEYVETLYTLMERGQQNEQRAADMVQLIDHEIRQSAEEPHTPEDLHEGVLDEAEAGERLMQTEKGRLAKGWIDEAINKDLLDNELMEDLFAVMDEETIALANEYIQAKAKNKGVDIQTENNVQSAVEAESDRISQFVYNDEGESYLIPVTYRGRNGYAVAFEGENVVVKFEDNGEEKIFLDSDEDLNVGNTQTVQQYMDNYTQLTQNEVAGAVEAARVNNPRTKVEPQVGDVIDTTGGQKRVASTTDGKVYLEEPLDTMDKEGNIVPKHPATFSPEDIVTPEEFVRMQNEFYDGEDRAAKDAEKAVEAEAVANVENEEVAPVEQPQPVEEKIGDEMPMMEVTDKKSGAVKQKPDFATAGAERSYNYIYNERGLERNDANAFVNNNLEAAQKKLEALQGKPVKMGTDLDEFEERKSKWQADVDAAQKDVDMWQNIKKLAKDDMLEQQREEAEAAKANKKVSELGEPLSMREWIMRALFNGGYKFDWEDDGETKGLGSHLGFSNSKIEKRKRRWMIGKRNEGALSPEKMAERMLNAYATDMGWEGTEGDWAVTSQDVLNELLDIVASNDRKSEMGKKIVQEHNEAETTLQTAGGEEVMSKEEEEYLKDNFAKDMGFNTYEEWEDYAEMANNSVEPFSKEEYDEIKRISAERYEEESVSLQQNEQLNTQNNGEAENQYAGVQGSSGLLPEEQVSDIGGTEQGEGNVGGGNKEVYNQDSGNLPQGEGTGQGVSYDYKVGDEFGILNDWGQRGKVEVVSVDGDHIVVDIDGYGEYDFEKGELDKFRNQAEQEKTNKKTIQGLENYEPDEVLNAIRGDVEIALDEAGLDDVVIKDMAIIGSRMRGDAEEDSDLDVLLEYEGDISEDALFNILHETPIEIEGINVDINPITKGKSGTIAEFMKRNEGYKKTSTPEQIEAEKQAVDKKIEELKEKRGELIRKRTKLLKKGLKFGFFDKTKIQEEVSKVYKDIEAVENEIAALEGRNTQSEPLSETDPLKRAEQIEAQKEADNKLYERLDALSTEELLRIAKEKEDKAEDLEKIFDEDREYDLIGYILNERGVKLPQFDEPEKKVEASRGEEDSNAIAGQETKEVEETEPAAVDFEKETMEEWQAFEKRVPKMSDEELLGYIEAQGETDYQAAHSSVYDEYDERHRDEYLERVDYYKSVLDDMFDGVESGAEDEVLERVNEMQANAQLQWEDGGYYSPERTALLAQMDAINEWIDEFMNREQEPLDDYNPVHRAEQVIEREKVDAAAQKIKDDSLLKSEVDVERARNLRQALADAYAAKDPAAIKNAIDAIKAYRDEGLDFEQDYNEAVDDYEGDNPMMLADKYIIHAYQDVYLDDDEDREYIKTGLTKQMRGEAAPYIVGEKKAVSPLQMDLFSDMDFEEENADTNTSVQNEGVTEPTQIRLRPLEEGESSYVERRYVENGFFDFTGTDKIESIDDVAYIFKQLQNVSMENGFIVLVKDGVPTVIHVGMGSYMETMLDGRQAFVAFRDMNPDKVYIVHNHPSGYLKCSKQDKELYANMHKLFGDKLEKGIIIDTTSGKYGLFDELTDYPNRLIDAQEKAGLKSYDNVKPIKVYTFSKTVFDPEWNPDTAFKSSTAADVAKFVSSHRLGEHKKLSLLILTNNHNIAGNVFLPWTSLKDAANKEGASLIAYYMNQMGGNAVILYGSTRDDDDVKSTKTLQTLLKNNGVRLMDMVRVAENQSDYESMAEKGLMEPSADYGTKPEAKEDEYFNAYNNEQETVNKRGGLVKNDAAERSMSPYWRGALHALGRLIGRRVVVLSGEDIAKMGYDPKSTKGLTVGNSIYLNEEKFAGDAEKLAFLHGHEITHILKKENPELWNAYVEAVKVVMGKAFTEEFTHKRLVYDAFYDAYNRRHPKTPLKKLTDAQIEEEICCDWSGRNVLTDEEAVKRIIENAEEAGADPVSLTQKILDYIKQWIADLKQALKNAVGNKEEISKNLDLAEKAKKLWQDMYNVAVARQNAKMEAAEAEESSVRFSLVYDPIEVARLESEPKETGYRNVVLNQDGTLGSPMADRLGKKGEKSKRTSSFEMGRWEKSDEHPEMATDDGKIDLVKPDNKKVGGVDYNPYIHIRPTLVNKQFKQAWERPNLVYVETLYPTSELTSGYQAEKAKKSVGLHDWNGGKLILSRYDKPMRIVPWEEVADDWVEEFKDSGVNFDIVPPALLPILSERGVEILPPHKGMGKECVEAYEEYLTNQPKFSLDDSLEKFQAKDKDVELENLKGDGLHNEDEYYLHGKLPKFFNGIPKDSPLRYSSCDIVSTKGDEISASHDSYGNIRVEVPESMLKGEGDTKTLKLSDIRDVVADEIGKTSEKNEVMFSLPEGEKKRDKEYADAVEAGDMEKAQKMVDEAAKDAGYTIRAYHGTGSYGFNTFKERREWNYDVDREEGVGIFFSSDKDNSTGYEDEEASEELGFENTQKGTYSVFLNIKNPLVVDFDGAWWNGRKFTYEVKNNEGKTVKTFSNLQEAKDFTRKQGDGATIENVEVGSGVKRIDKYVTEARQKGYDGVIIKNVRDSHLDNHEAHPATTYVVFKPNQIKSAGIEYDDNGKLVPLSERFSENDDIRFSLDEENVREEKRDSEESKKVFDAAMFSLDDSEPFYSNAEKAVTDIKQEKATPEQWLKMIEKNAGLKAGEDKWLGLSDWLKSSDAKTLTKDEVLDYIRKNEIQIEEVDYGELNNVDDNEKLREFKEEFAQIQGELTSEKENLEREIGEFDEEMYEKYGEGWYNQLTGKEREYADAIENRYRNLDDSDDAAFREMVSRYGDDFEQGFEVVGGELEPVYDYYENGLTEAARYFLDIDEKPINDTRLNYTTDGLDNKREIALVVPSIESWNTGDEIHFGDAGEGRAVAWVRFGDTTTNAKGGVSSTAIMDELEKKYDNVDDYSKMTDEDAAKRAFANYLVRDNADVDMMKQWLAEDVGEDRAENVVSLFDKLVNDNKKGQRVLVIDEIQSKRHQEGREQGYKSELANTPKGRWRKAVADMETFKKEMEEKYGKYYLQDVLTDEERARHEELMAEELAAFDAYDTSKESKLYNIPDAPFEKNWHELAMKRMLRYAAENGYDKVAWTKGEQQAERYSLGKVYNSVEREDNPSVNGKRFVFSGENVDNFTVDDNGVVIDATLNEAVGKSLGEVVGKDLAVKMMGMENGDMLDSEELRIGGEGMKGFYDQILPRFMDKYGKKWGVKTGEIELPNLEESAQKMWAVDVTPEMKESVMQGQPMFSLADEALDEYDPVKRAEQVMKREKVAKVRGKFDELSKKYNGKKYDAIPYKGLSDEALLDVLGAKGELRRSAIEEMEDVRKYFDDERKKSFYNPFTDKILIFADRIKEGGEEEAFFHENVHGILQDWYGEGKRSIAERFWDAAPDEGLSKKEFVKKNYHRDLWKEELFTHWLGKAMVKGRVDEVLNLLNKEDKQRVNNILNILGYDKEEENARRAEENGAGLAEQAGVLRRGRGESDADSEQVMFSLDDESSEEKKPSVRDTGYNEVLTKAKIDIATRNKDDVDARMRAIQAIGGNLSQLRRAMSLQRDYDRKTVDRIVKLARMVMDTGFIDELSRGEVKKLLGLVNGAAGKEDISQSAKKVVDMLVNHQLRECENLLAQQLRVKGSKLTGKGVEVQGRLDIEGQRMVKALKDGMKMDEEGLNELMADALDKMGSEDPVAANNAAVEYQGLLLAKQYLEEVRGKELEATKLRMQLRKAKEESRASEGDYGRFTTRDSYLEYLNSVDEALSENQFERIEAYLRLLDAIGGRLADSIEGAKEWREQEAERVAAIQHDANSDMKGKPAHTQQKMSWWDKAKNMGIVRWFMQPLATFDEMLRFIGEKSVDGRGYLWNRYMNGWANAQENYWRGIKEAHDELDAKVKELFSEGTYIDKNGKKKKLPKIERWSDLFSLVRKMPGADVTFWDDGEQTYKLSAGNLLYIYMVDKMTDGRMKLRRMGISEEDVDDIKRALDPRFVQLADWMQEEYLVKKREKYNAVYERMFGAPMAAIEHYFPLNIDKKALNKTEDISAYDGREDINPAIITGSVIKRKTNVASLDLVNSDAFDLMLKHLEGMEKWAAFAEFNRDLSTLLSYKKFRNRLSNMKSLRYGAGDTVLENFKTVAAIAGGAYRPHVKKDSIDALTVNLAKGVTAAKISMRFYTALKQLLSYPAYLSEANLLELAKSSNPVGAVKAWNWAMKNLPMFAERWQSRKAGDYRLEDTELDWAAWHKDLVRQAARIGMSPNAFVDGLTVAMGAKAVYETAKKRYLKDGLDSETAERKALLDAAVAYNETQQSSQSAFMSAMQLDRTFASVALTVFRNASMAYERRMVRALANMKKRMNPKYKDNSQAFMQKMLEREGMGEEEARKASERMYRRQQWRDAVDVAVFGYILQAAWNLAPYLPYLLSGDDDDKKKEMLEDALRHAVFGGIEGLPAGNLMSDIGNLGWQIATAKDQKRLNKLKQQAEYKDFNLLPLMSDLQDVINHALVGSKSAIVECVNLLLQSGVGVNPQTFSDAVVATIDAFNGDLGAWKEFAFAMARIFQTPQTSMDMLYIDELGMFAHDARRLSLESLAKRWAKYKMRKENPLTMWIYTDEEKKDLEDKYIKRFEEKVQERIENMEEGELMDAFDWTDGAEERKMLGKEIAKKEGSEDAYGNKPASTWKKETQDAYVDYQRCRDAEDVKEDALLTKASKEAKGDRKKAIEKARQSLNKMKQGLGKGNDAAVMEGIRTTRKQIMKNFEIE